jgi:hypothetical protein
MKRTPHFVSFGFCSLKMLVEGFGFLRFAPQLVGLICCCLIVCGTSQQLCSVANERTCMDLLLQRLPGNCTVSASACQSELANQIAGIRPLDGEVLFLSRYPAFSVLNAFCYDEMRNRSFLSCSQTPELHNATILITRIPGNFAFVNRQAFNVSLHPWLRACYRRRVPFCIMRERDHLLNALASCSGNVNCQNTFRGRLNELRMALQLAWIDLIDLRYRILDEVCCLTDFF